ncbi:MAG: hypothetical protein ACI9FN_002536, partial [Saprospiraceae bacterium]
MYSSIYFLVGIAVAIYALRTNAIAPQKEAPVSRIWIFGLILLIGMIAQDVCKPLFDIWPLDYRSADMLPVISIMVDRYYSSSEVYAIIPEIWNGMQPIYLPGLWMPYIMASLAGIDIRWVNIIFLLLGSLLLLRPWKKAIWQVYSLGSMVTILLALWMTWMYLDQGMIALTEEGIVIGYYSLLCVALISGRPVLIGIMIGLCMMSRYMLAPWAAMFVIAIWLWQGKSQAFR